MSKQKNSKRRRYAKAAAKAPAWARDIVTSKTNHQKRSRHYCDGLGKFGAASPVKVLVRDGVPVDDGAVCA